MNTTVVLPASDIKHVRKTIANFRTQSPRHFALNVAKKAYRLFVSKKYEDAQLALEEAIATTSGFDKLLEVALAEVILDSAGRTGKELTEYNKFLDLCFDANLDVDVSVDN